jgi:mRNA interferase MazF
VAAVLRGDVVWADFNPTRGREQSGVRPVLVLSHDLFNSRSETAIVVALTSKPQRAGFPLTLKLDENSRLPKPWWVKISQVRTISVERLGKRLFRVSPEQLQEVIEGLLELIG